MLSSSLPSGVYLNPICTTASALSHASTRPISQSQNSDGFVDHYAILQLDNWATSEEIKAAYRRLRVEFFRTDAVKYRALQAAFDVLADREARWSYDRMYRGRKGLPVPVGLDAGAGGMTNGKGEGTATARGKDQGKGTVIGKVRALEDSIQTQTFAAAVKSVDTAPLRAVEAEVEDLETTMQAMDVRDPDDANWALKRYSVRQGASSVMGTCPYHSFVPMLQVYEGRAKHPKLKCTRPRYVGGMARMAVPA
jgi:curved DNA-binding protein CbpA